MSAVHECVVCGGELEAGSRAKYCGAACRKRASRAGQSRRAAGQARTDSTVVMSTVRTLEDAGRLDTVLGQQAVMLATRMSSPSETGGAVAALSRELRAVMTAALAEAQVADPVDELQARRDAKRAKSTG